MNVTELPEDVLVRPLLKGVATGWDKSRPAFIGTHYCSDLGQCPRARWCRYLRLAPSNPTSGEQRMQMAYGDASERVLFGACMAARLHVSDRQRRVWYRLGERAPKRFGPEVMIFGHIDGTVQHGSLGRIGLEGKLTGPDAYAYVLRHGPKMAHLAQVHGYMAGMNAQRWLVVYMTHRVPRGVLVPPLTAYLVQWDGGLWDFVLDDISVVELGLAERRPPPRTRRDWQAWACKPEWCVYFDRCMAPGADDDLAAAAVEFFKNPPPGGGRFFRVSPRGATRSGGVSGHGPGRAVPGDAPAGRPLAGDEPGATAPASEPRGERGDGPVSAEVGSQDPSPAVSGPPAPADLQDPIDGRR